MSEKKDILDACSLLNLYASGHFESILASGKRQYCVVEHVLNESLYTRQPAETESGYEYVPVNLEPFLQNKLLEKIKLETEIEQNWFVKLAQNIDDGEAATFAVAIARKMRVITDDRKAINVLRRESPETICLATLEVIKKWTIAENITADAIQKALQDIELFAKYRPGKKHFMFEWWQQKIGYM